MLPPVLLQHDLSFSSDPAESRSLLFHRLLVCWPRTLSLLVTFLPLVAAVPCKAQVCEPVPGNLVAWWRGEGNADDAVSGNNGTMTGDAVFGYGSVGASFWLDGNGDGVLITNVASLQLQDLTIECWIKRASDSKISFGSGNTAIIFGYGDGGYSFYLGGDNYFRFGKLGTVAVGSGAYVADTNFHHVAITKSGTTLTFYVDGVAYPGPEFNYSFEFLTPVAIGFRPDNSDNSFNGGIDELGVYSRALSEAELQAIYAAGSAGKCTAPSQPVVIVPPRSTSAEPGETIQLSVAASGTAPLSYLWRFGESDLPTATSTSLSLTNVQPGQAGEYRVVVTNDYGSVTSVVALISVPPPCGAWPTGLVAWWRGETNAYDHFGRANGSLRGNTTYASGKAGSGFLFDGSTGRIAVGNPTNLQLQNLTVEAWIKRSSDTITTSNGSAGIFGYINGGYNCYLGGNAHLYFGKLGTVAYPSAGSILGTNFHHVAWTKTGTTVRFYIDGLLDSTISFTPTFTFTTSALIGAHLDNASNNSTFLGTIDEVALYNRALSAAEILTLKQAGSSGKCPTNLAPSISQQPAHWTGSPGSNVTISVGVVGTPPFDLRWYRNDTYLTSTTNASLTFSNIQPNNAGNYVLLVTNSAGAVTSSVATVKVVTVSFKGNGQTITNAINAYAGPVTVELINAFTNGLTFYTLDGSAPSFLATPYTGAFLLTQSTVVRAIGYSADFFQAGESDPVTFQILPTYGIAVSTPGGGSVALNPPSGPYLSNSVVNLNATPNPGWTFLRWLGDATGTNANINVTMSRSKAAQAIFGTTLNTTAAGGGSVILNPPGGVYPFGSVVQLSAIPTAGNYFGIWGNAASGNINPLFFTLTNANPTVSSLFAPVSGGQVGFTVVSVGRGTITVTPRANVYAAGTGVSVTAVPEAGQTFLGWTGDANGSANPLGLTLNSSMLIYANFTKRPWLFAAAPFGSLSKEGMQLTVTGAAGEIYQIESSSNCVDWVGVVLATNIAGSATFTDTGGTNATHRFYRAVTVP